MRTTAIVLFMVASLVATAGAQQAGSSASQPAAPQQTGSPANPPAVTLPADLARVLADYEKAWGAKDAKKLALLFAPDGYVLPNGNTPVHGRAAIERFYTGHGGPLALRPIAYAAEGSVGYIIGAYAGAVGAPEDGKFTLTLRKESDGRWLIVSDMDNLNRRRE